MIRAVVEECAEMVRWVIPLVGKHEGGLECLTGKNRFRICGKCGHVILELDREPEEVNPIFFLNGGFEGWEVVLCMEKGEAGRCWIRVET